MTTSKRDHSPEAFVWIWLKNKTFPVVCGHIVQKNGLYAFNYGRHYLEDPSAMPLSPLELSLKPGDFFPEGMNTIHGCLRDAAPDAWGRRLIDYKHERLASTELDYMLLSGSDRIGALDFQTSSTEYIHRGPDSVPLEDLLELTTCVEQNKSLPPDLEYALLRGTSVGGARPKALMQDNKAFFIAKFGLSADLYNIIKAEYVAMRLAKYVGIHVPSVALRHVLGKDILLIERFDRYRKPDGVARRFMLSGLTLLGLNELEARYASYPDLADIIRHHGLQSQKDLEALYKRLVFNILIGNTDDHARNHSTFWDGEGLELTPAYDICPQPRIGQEATQAMAIEGSEKNDSTLINALSVSDYFQIPRHDALQCIHQMLETIQQYWVPVCEEADLSILERSRLWGNAIFNPFCFRGWK